MLILTTELLFPEGHTISGILSAHSSAVPGGSGSRVRVAPGGNLILPSC